MSKELEKILEKLEQLLPPPPPEPEWKASVAFRWRSSGRRATAGWLQPVRHVHRIKRSPQHPDPHEASALAVRKLKTEN